MFSASIVLYRSNGDDISRLIDGLQSSGVVDVIYLVDNSPEPCFVPVDESGIVSFHRPDNPGYGSGHNIAMRHAVANGHLFHLVVNPDIAFGSDALPRLLEYMVLNKRVVQLMPEVVDPAGQLQYLCKALPTPLDLFLRRFPLFPLGLLHERLDARFTLRFWDHRTIEEIPVLSGCFMVLRLSAVETVGYFDERYFMYLEDFDLTRRLAEVGATVYTPEVTVVHRHEKASFRSHRMLLAHISSAIRYFQKWGWFFDRDRRQRNRELFQRLGLIRLNR